MLWRPLLSLPLFVVVVAIASGVASQAGSVVASDDTITTVLYPGDNLIGWVEADAPTDHVFDQIPELQSIRSRSSGSTWFVARPADGEGRSSRPLRMGRGYWFHVASERPIEWQRSMDQRSAVHRLNPGQHIVAWAGVDGVPLRNAMLPIVDAAASAMHWDAEHRRLTAWSSDAAEVLPLEAPNPFTTEHPIPTHERSHWSSRQLRAGDAIVLKVVRSLRWVQPTGQLPGIRFVGDVSEEIRRFVKEDTEFVIQHVARRFGIEADPARLTIEVPASWADLYGEDEERWPDAAAYARPPPRSQPWRHSVIVAPAKNWSYEFERQVYGLRRSGRGVLLHEYFHALQFHLALANFGSVPGWLVEGTAIASTSEFFARKAGQDSPPRLARAEPLSDIVGADNKHTIGAAAVQRLIHLNQPDVYFEFWRELGSRSTDPGAWRQVFSDLFGRPVDVFYEEFERWIRTLLPLVEGRLVGLNPGGNEHLKVTIHDADHRNLQTDVDRAGEFRMAVKRDQQFLIQLTDTKRDCSAYVNSDGRPSARADAARFTASSWLLTIPPITLDGELCRYSISFRLLGPSAQSISGIRAELCAPNTSPGYQDCHGTTAPQDGVLMLRAAAPGRYSVRLEQGEGVPCQAYIRGNSLTRAVNLADSLAVSHLTSSPRQLRVGSSICAGSITGTIRGLAGRNDLFDGPRQLGQPEPVEMLGCPRERMGCFKFDLRRDGTYSKSIAFDAQIQLLIVVHIHHADGRTTTCKTGYQRPPPRNVRPDPARYDFVSVFSEGWVELDWEVGPDFCRRTVGGVWLDTSGGPQGGRELQACRSTRLFLCEAVTTTSPDGVFELVLPGDGAYVLAPVDVNQCPATQRRSYLEEEGIRIEPAGSDLELGIIQMSDALCQ